MSSKRLTWPEPSARFACAVMLAVVASSGSPASVSATSAATEAPPSPQIITHELKPAETQEDFARLRFNLAHAHAAPYRYTSEAELNRQLDALGRRLDHPMTDLDFYRLLAPLIAEIRNSHTSIQPPADALRSMRTYQSVFPFILRYRDGRAFIEVNLSNDTTIRPGMEVLSLGDRSMADVTRNLMENRSAEGFDESGKYARLDQTFWLDFMLKFGPSARYAVRVRNATDGEESEHTVAGASAERLAAAVPQFPSVSGPTQSLTIERESGIAVMRLKNFLEPDTPAFFQKAFHDLAVSGARNLIIDLRGNHGGIDWFNSELLSYLSSSPFRFYKKRSYRVQSYDDLKYLTYNLDDFLFPDQIAALPAAVRERPFQHWTLPQLIDLSLATDHAGGVQVPKATDHFAGRVYLLIDGMSGSSSAEVPALMHHLGLATIIGEDPNGSYQGEVAGIIPTLTLPNSKLNIRIPLIAYQNEVMPGVRVGRAVEPTFTVSETLDDSIAGVDTVMEFTKALIFARAPAK